MTANWTEFILGIWLLISPWLLGFSSISIMKWSNILTGLILVLINAWIIFGQDGKFVQGQNIQQKN